MQLEFYLFLLVIFTYFMCINQANSLYIKNIVDYIMCNLITFKFLTIFNKIYS